MSQADVTSSGLGAAAARGTSATGSRARLFDIDRAKGIAILLVVVGHIGGRQPPPGADWYIVLKSVIYTFHMPFFMFLSGFVFYYVRNHSDALPSFLHFLRTRSFRLLVPFFLFGLIIVFGKYFSQFVLHVDNFSGALGANVINLFWYTASSPALSIWYMFALFVISMFAFLAHRMIANVEFWFVFSLLFFFVDVPAYMYLHKVFPVMPFFFLGGLVVARHDAYVEHVDRFGLYYIVVFLAALVFGQTLLSTMEAQLICGLCAVPALHYLARSLDARLGNFFAWLGHYSFSIYLLNTICIGVAKGVMLYAITWSGEWFYVFFIVLFAAGLFVPILVRQWVFTRVRWLEAMTR